MARVTYIRPLSKVGFRLVGATNPARAAALSGIAPPTRYVYSGLGVLGDDSSTLANIGFSSDQISQIMAAHQACSLSDQGYQQLLSGTVDPSQLDAFLGTDVGCPTAASGAPAAAAPAGGAPTGSTIAYQGVWTTANYGQSPNAVNPDAIMQAVSAQLPAYGLSLVGYNVVQQASMLDRALGTDTPFTINVTLRVTGSGFDTPQNAVSNLEHIVYTITGNMPQQGTAALVGMSAPGAAGPGSSIPTLTSSAWQSIFGGGGGGGAGGASPPGSIGAFLEQNMTTILLALGAIVVAPALIKKL